MKLSQQTLQNKIIIAVAVTVMIALTLVSLTTFFRINHTFDDLQRERIQEIVNLSRLQSWPFLTEEDAQLIEKIAEIEAAVELDIYRAIVFASLISFAVAFILGIVLARQINKPIMRLTQALDNLRENRRQQKLLATGPVELRQLTESFNQLLSELERVEQLRDELVTDLAHEMNTPLTKIKGEMEGIVDGVYRADTKTLQRILTNIEQVEYLVDQLNHYSDIRARTSTLKLEKIELYPFLQQIIQGYQGKDISFSLDLAKQDEVKADYMKFKEIMENIIGNAYKYTDAGEIIIRYNKGILEVKDTGIGIPEKDINYVFERLYRVEKSRNKERGGLGLGLAIVKELVEQHSWKITLESKVGQGTVVRLNLTTSDNAD